MNAMGISLEKSKIEFIELNRKGKKIQIIPGEVFLDLLKG